MDRYVRKFAGRHNDRRRHTIDQTGYMIKGMKGMWLRYKDLKA